MFKMVRISKEDLSSTIWDIMKAGDLTKLTAKKIRALCEEKFKVNLIDRKSEIDDIVVAFVKKYCDDARAGKEAKVEKPVENVKAVKAAKEKKSEEVAASSDSSSDSESNSGSECSDSESSDEESDQASSQTQTKQKSLPPKKVPAKNNVSVAAKKKKVQPAKTAPAPKKIKKNEALEKSENVLDDEALARKIQAEEFGFRAATIKRGLSNTSKKVKTKTEDTKQKKKARPFSKKCVLSPVLAEVIGETEMSRPDVVQKMWSIVRDRNLFDESNKQFALCDEQLKKLFGKKRIRLIGMMKYLKNHIKDIQ